MTSSFAQPSFGSTPYTQHHKQNPNPFSQADTQSHVYGTYERMIRSYLTQKITDLGASVGSTRLTNIAIQGVDSAAGSITASQLVGEYINVTGIVGQTLALPSNADVVQALALKFGPLRSGMTIPVFIINQTGGALNITDPLTGGTVIIGLAAPTAFTANEAQIAFIRIPANDSTTYQYINTSPSSIV
jgi:hypothetical protein